MICQKCFTENPDQSKYCSNCGTKLGVSEEAISEEGKTKIYRSIDEKDKSKYNVIKTVKLRKSYGKRLVVDEVSFQMKRGEVVGLLGPNGAGKTTTFYMVVGLITPNNGEIFLNERNISKLPMYRRARLGIGYLAQEASVFRKLSVENNIKAILELTSIPKAKKKERLEALLEDLEIARIRKSMGYALSGGERRRTEIARALATRPNFLLLDEPFAGVDPIAVQEIQRIIMKLKNENDIGILITDHNARETLRITDRSYILADGKLLYKGSAEELANNPDVRRVYLGDNFKL